VKTSGDQLDKLRRVVVIQFRLLRDVNPVKTGMASAAMTNMANRKNVYAWNLSTRDRP